MRTAPTAAAAPRRMSPISTPRRSGPSDDPDEVVVVTDATGLPLVVRTGPNQMRVDDFNLWAAPLQDSIGRIVAQNLVTLLGTPRVTLTASAVRIVSAEAFSTSCWLKIGSPKATR